MICQSLDSDDQRVFFEVCASSDEFVIKNMKTNEVFHFPLEQIQEAIEKQEISIKE